MSEFDIHRWFKNQYLAEADAEDLQLNSLKNNTFTYMGHEYTVKKAEKLGSVIEIQTTEGKSFNLNTLLQNGVEFIKPQKAKRTAWNKGQKSSPQWNAQKYKQWIRDNASNGGAENSWDMAQNAKHTPGLIAYVRKQIDKNWGDESPLERIQWDIEAYA